MIAHEPLYILSETLYRIGNASSPQLAKVRTSDVSTTEVNGVTIVLATGDGVSLYNKDGLERSGLSGWVWEIPAGTQLPFGLTMRRKEPPAGHYVLCPASNMPFHKFLGLLEDAVLSCRKLYQRKRA